MWQPKSDVYRTEWLDLVFDNRNKSYGAYELRRHNGKTSIRALLILPVLVSGVFLIWLVNVRLAGHEPMVIRLHDPETVVELSPITESRRPENSQIEQIVQPPPKAAGVKPHQDVSLNLVPAVSEDILSVSISEVEGNGGVETTIGPSGVSGNLFGTGDAAPSLPAGEEVISFELLERYPEFPGGQGAFAKYLSRNLRYPHPAVQSNISGRVIISFIVEKDGRLSDIKVIRGIGGGCDEEAVRVLGKAPAWSPGIQNGKPVRVAYTVPIYFSLQN